MTTMKNGQISLYCHFNKIIKRSGTSYQSPALSQKHVRNVCHTAHYDLTKFHFDKTQDSKEISKVYFLLCSNAFDGMIDFEICGFHKNTKIQISCERNIIFSSNKKIHQLHAKGNFMAKNSFAVEVTFKELLFRMQGIFGVCL